jgi:ubiquinone/menaquinone biosynthesis C-methylase UbiE
MASDVEKFLNFCKSEFGKGITDTEAEYIQSELKLKTRDKILNIGCGTGWLEEKLPHLNITGLDSSEEMLEEARKRSDKTFVIGDAEHLKFKDSTFDAVFIVTTLKFLDDYKKAVKETARVTKHYGKILVMMLNPKSEYFKEGIKKVGGYFRRIKHTNLKEIKDHVSKFYAITKEEYFLGIRGQHTFDTNDDRYASLFVIVGVKK